ncbi:MAG: hypothetical protein EBU85_02190 [Actinobacteria bacterium]|nr:hypothetical protein [Actinomycetota bacterium]
MRQRVIAFVATVAVGMVSAPIIPTAFAVPTAVPASAQSVAIAVSNYNTARDRYVDSLNVYLSNNRRSTQEYTTALRDYTSANTLLGVAKRDIAKTCSDDIKAATAIYNAAKKAAKTPEAKAAAVNAYNAAIAAAAAGRESATESLRPMPAAPPKVLKK